MTSSEQKDQFFDDDEEDIEELELAHVDFDLLETQGKWFLKVLAGPNSGAEFSMQRESSYLIGTDTETCDIIFHDLSVSRQHARIVIDADDKVVIEDLNSRNGTFVDGEKITGRKAIASSTLITMGTTTFVVMDRKGERKTIISPLFITTVEKQGDTAPAEEGTKDEGVLGPIAQAALPPVQSEIEKIKEEERKQARIAHSLSALIVLGAITGIFIIIAVGTTLLFKPVQIHKVEPKDPDKIISEALKDFPSVRYSYNPATGKLLLIGHVLTDLDRDQIINDLDSLKFITSIDASNIIIDQYVWQEINQLLAKNPAWKGVTVTAPAPGKFVLTGFLKTRKEANALYDYISQNFSYPNLLENRIVVEQDIKDSVIQKLLEHGFRGVTVDLQNGDLTFQGAVEYGEMPQFDKIVKEARAIRGVRVVHSYVVEAPQRETMVNLTDKYPVTGYSIQGNKISVVIDGKILHKGDILDNKYQITDIEPNSVLLEKDGVKYRIDFNS